MAVKYKLVAIPDGADDTASSVNTTPGCKFNPVGVACNPENRRCENCGWNPAVAAARLQKRYPGYRTPLAPARKEALLNGNWDGPDNG